MESEKVKAISDGALVKIIPANDFLIGEHILGIKQGIDEDKKALLLKTYKELLEIPFDKIKTIWILVAHSKF